MRDYFASLGDSAHPNSTDPRARAITRFQELLLVSFREFAVITDESILSERRRFRGEIIHSIESFAKRSAVRNLKTLGRFSKEQAGLVYDALYKAMCIVPPPMPVLTPSMVLPPGEQSDEKPETRIGLRTFLNICLRFLCNVSNSATDGSRGRRARVHRQALLLLGYITQRRSIVSSTQFELLPPASLLIISVTGFGIWSR
jgi:hypothetical protein